MAKTKISEFSSTPGNNTDIDGINIAEGCAPSGINDAIRELMSQLKDFQAGTAGDSFNGPVGTTTAAAGAFTTLSASSTVSGTGFSTYLASPPAIGGTAAAAGSFTTLSASSTVTLSGGTANGVTYLNGSKVLTSGTALTFDGTTLGTNRFSMTGFLATFNNDNFYMEFQRSGTPFGYIGTGSNTAGGAVTDLGVRAQNNLVFAANATEQMRLTSTGLGIGTSSPAAKLHISGSTTPNLRFEQTNSSVVHQFQAASGNFYLNIDATNVAGGSTFLVQQAGTTVLTLNSSGNLGLGVTPSAWNSVYRTMQLGAGSSLSGRTDNATWTELMSNTYRASDGTWKYITTNSASLYAQNAGAHAWSYAASGTAGNTISFTQAMTLDASGNLGIGTTSPSRNLAVYGSSLGAIALQNSSTGTASSDGFQIQAYLTQAYIWNYENDFMSFGTNATERARIDSSGIFQLGTTSKTTDTDFKLITDNRTYGIRNDRAGSRLDIVDFTAGSVRASIDSSGNLLVGATTVGTWTANSFGVQTSAGFTVTAHANSTADGTAYAYFDYNNSPIGSITQNGTTAVAYNTSSDYRLKDNPQPLTGSGAFIDALKPKTWTWKADGSKGVGFIAHEVQEVSPGSVVGEKDGEQMQAMEYGSAEFIANIIAELQQLRVRVAQLEKGA